MFMKICLTCGARFLWRTYIFELMFNLSSTYVEHTSQFYLYIGNNIDVYGDSSFFYQKKKIPKKLKRW